MEGNASLQCNVSVIRSVARNSAFSNTCKLWDALLDAIGNETSIAYVEFGVHQGFSISYAAARNNNPESRFIGLDSFEGLPENWGEVAEGTFSTGGTAPSIRDSRVSFIKGWFQDTWSTLNSSLPKRNILLVHFDADLYSSTLFVLCKIDDLGQTYIAVFDEFSGHECAALFNYIESYGAKVVFHGHTKLDSNPLQVWCTITPKAH